MAGEGVIVIVTRFQTPGVYVKPPEKLRAKVDLLTELWWQPVQSDSPGAPVRGIVGPVDRA